MPRGSRLAAAARWVAAAGIVGSAAPRPFAHRPGPVFAGDGRIAARYGPHMFSVGALKLQLNTIRLQLRFLAPLLLALVAAAYWRCR
ncbi:MAG: hypothetical protein U1F25_10115 [Rubrivivax sp.]